MSAPIEGGQGRSGDEIEDRGYLTLFVFFLPFVLALGALIAWGIDLGFYLLGVGIGLLIC